jgi:hypothetical protein
MWESVLKAGLLALLEFIKRLFERKEALDREQQLGKANTVAETNKKTAETEHEMAKIDANPATADSVADSLRNGKF